MRNFYPLATLRLALSPLVKLLLVSLVVANAAPAMRADIEHAADDRQRSIWQSVLGRMPDGWKRARRVEVYWVSDREMDRLIADQEEEDNQRGDDSTIQGFYDRAPDGRSPATITVRTNLSRDDAIFVLSHEYAHMVWDDILSRRDRAEYKSIWEDQRRSRRLVSRYAGESPEEGFAESIASYLWEREKLKRRDDLSYDFVADLIHLAEEKESPEGRDSPRG